MRCIVQAPRQMMLLMSCRVWGLMACIALHGLRSCGAPDAPLSCHGAGDGLNGVLRGLLNS